MVIKKSIRFCKICKELTKHNLNKIIGHSECVKCGARFNTKFEVGLNDNDMKKFNKILKKLVAIGCVEIKK